MTAVVSPAAAPAHTAPTGEHIAVPAWAFALVAVGLLVSYLVLQENGLVLSNWMIVHELAHDGRHALGFPCH
jgi:cobalt transporter subunit CbtB